jgi:hypothetical protein
VTQPCPSWARGNVNKDGIICQEGRRDKIFNIWRMALLWPD